MTDDDEDESWTSFDDGKPTSGFWDDIGCGIMFFLIAIGISGCEYLEALAKHLGQ